MSRVVLLVAAAATLARFCSKDPTPDAGVIQAPVVTVDAGAPFVSRDGGVHFVTIGDTGKGNPPQFRVGAAIAAFCKTHECDFVVLLGDNFYPTGVSSTSDPQWQSAFVEPYADINVPFYAVLGNHDYGGNGAGTELPKGDFQVAYSLVNPKWRMPAHHYKWARDDVEFFVADTNRSMFGIDSRVSADFEAWLTASTAKWKIAFGHHPLKSNGPHGNAGTYDGVPYVPVANGSGVKEFYEAHVCGRADFLIAAHDHNIQWLEATCTRPGSKLNTGLIVSGGGASTTTLRFNQPNYYQSDAPGFVYFEIVDDTFTATFINWDGVQEFTKTVRKQ